MLESRAELEEDDEVLRQPESLLSQSGAMRVAEHIVKSLNFKGVSLEQELNQYFAVNSNYGFIPQDKFLEFLRETGISVE